MTGWEIEIKTQCHTGIEQYEICTCIKYIIVLVSDPHFVAFCHPLQTLFSRFALAKANLQCIWNDFWPQRLCYWLNYFDSCFSWYWAKHKDPRDHQKTAGSSWKGSFVLIKVTEG